MPRTYVTHVVFRDGQKVPEEQRARDGTEWGFELTLRLSRTQATRLIRELTARLEYPDDEIVVGLLGQLSSIAD